LNHDKVNTYLFKGSYLKKSNPFVHKRKKYYLVYLKVKYTRIASEIVVNKSGSTAKGPRPIA
jgi:hypothetical protein